MGQSYWVRLGALCFVALACEPQGPGAKHAPAPAPRPAPRAAAAAERRTAPHDAVPAASAEPTAASAPSGAADALQRVPRVRLQAIVVESSDLPVEVVQRIVRQRALELRDCYLPRLKERPQLEGQLHFRLQLASDGDVSNVVAVVDTLGDSATSSCVKAIIQSLVLPAPGAPAVIVVPLLFAPSGVSQFQ